MPYASATTVPVEKTRLEIERVLSKHGASGFMTGFMGDRAFVQFLSHSRYVRFVLKIPQEMDYAVGPSGRRRPDGDRRSVYEQSLRQKWRALLLVIKAKLESVESGVSTFEQEFLAHIMLPNNKTVGEFMGPQIEMAYSTGQMPAMLPGIGETHRGDDEDAHSTNE